MTIEIFEGRPEALKARLEVIAGGSTINLVLATHQAGVYIIMYT